MSSWRSGPENKDGICGEECRCIPSDKPGEVWSESERRRCESVRRHAHLLSTCPTPAAQFQARIAPQVFDLRELSLLFINFFRLYPLFFNSTSSALTFDSCWLSAVTSFVSFFPSRLTPGGWGAQRLHIFCHTLLLLWRKTWSVCLTFQHLSGRIWAAARRVCVCVCVWPAVCLAALPLPLTSLKHCI